MQFHLFACQRVENVDSSEVPSPPWVAYVSLYPTNAHRLQEESDLPYEEEILRHPFQLKCWLRYLEHKRSAPKAVINLIYERALKELPGRLACVV